MSRRRGARRGRRARGDLRAAAAGLALAVLAAGCSHPAYETRGARVGILTCHAMPGTRVNVLILSSVQVECLFAGAGFEDRYRGETGIQLGIDLSWLPSQTFRYAVLTAYQSARPGFLAGNYVGARANATAGLGLGVGVLVGGGDDSVSLQPLSVDVSSGVGVAAGISYLTLEPAR